MPLPEQRHYFLEIDEESEVFDEATAAEERIFTALRRPSGRISLCADGGDRPFLHRLLGAKIWVVGYFSVEWHNGLAGLIFLDDNMSEHRAIDEEGSVEYSQSDHDQIRFGDRDPIDRKFIMSTPRVKDALKQFLQTSRRPSWLKYEFIE